MRLTVKKITDSLIEAGVDALTSVEIANNIKKLAELTRTPMGKVASYDGYIYIPKRPAEEPTHEGAICVFKGERHSYFVAHVFKSQYQANAWGAYIN